VRAVFAYDGIARKAVHQLKFRSGRFLAPVLGDLMRGALQRRPMVADVVVPVPLAPRRLRERGYNQALLLANEIAGSTGGRLGSHVLERTERPSQRGLSATQRRLNLEGAVQVARGAHVDGQRVLLVDDVMTTGATLSVCAEALAEAGAARVSALVFARAL